MKRIIPLYFLMLGLQVALVFEQIYSLFWGLQVLGMGVFLLINLLWYIVPLFLLFYLLRLKRWAFILSIVYASIMVVTGLTSFILLLITRNYYGGFAGAFSGAALAAVGIPLLTELRRYLHTTNI
jgi:hypothetical protein